MNKKFAILFPGSGVQVKGMGKDIYNKFSTAKDIYDQAEEITPFDTKKISFSDYQGGLEKIESFQTVSVVFDLAIFKTLESNGLTPSVVSGLSLGQFAGIYAAKMLNLKDILDLVTFFSKSIATILDRSKGRIYITRKVPLKLLNKLLQVSNGKASLISENSTTSMVYGGDAQISEQIKNKLNSLGYAEIIEIPNIPPVHTKMANSLANGMSNYLDTLNWHNNQIPLISDTDAIFINKNNVKQAILKQLFSGTHFINSIKKILSMGITNLVCIGPGVTIPTFVKDIADNLGLAINLYNVVNSDDLLQVITDLTSK